MGKLENLSKVKCLQFMYNIEKIIDEDRLEFNTPQRLKPIMINKDWRLKCIWMLESTWWIDEQLLELMSLHLNIVGVAYYN